MFPILGPNILSHERMANYIDYLDWDEGLNLRDEDYVGLDLPPAVEKPEKKENMSLPSIDVYEWDILAEHKDKLERPQTSIILKIAYLNDKLEIKDRRYVYLWLMYKLIEGYKYKKYAFGDRVSEEIVSYSIPKDGNERIKKNLSFIVQDEYILDVLNTLVDTEQWLELFLFIEDTLARSESVRCIGMILNIIEINIVSDSLSPADGKVGYLYNLYKLNKDYTVTCRFGGSTSLTMNLLGWAKYIAIQPERYYDICKLIGY